MRIVAGNYKILYRIDEANAILYVNAVFDTRQDPGKLSKM